MKHNFQITLLLILIFLIAQLVGINIVSQYIDIEETSTTGVTVVRQEEYIVAPPEIENESHSWIFILFAILFGTAIILIMIKFRMQKIWKFWFSLSVFLALLIGTLPYIRKIAYYLGLFNYSLMIASIIIFILTYLKVWTKGFIAKNITEIFIYGGIAALLVPIINIQSGIIILIGIALYDAFAVWKSKHMVKMAEFQTKSAFAGLEIPYDYSEKKNKKTKYKKTKSVERNTAILGGGDIAFPLIFAGVVLKTTGSFISSLIVIIFTTVFLALLLFLGKPGKFYPAMPFLSSGSLLGYLFVLII